MFSPCFSPIFGAVFTPPGRRPRLGPPPPGLRRPGAVAGRAAAAARGLGDGGAGGDLGAAAVAVSRRDPVVYMVGWFNVVLSSG